MNIEEFRTFCLSKKGVTEHFPFDKDTLVFKVCDKMFALSSLKKWEEGAQFINLKCNPDYAVELREKYESILPGYHMSKKHWNSVHLHSNELPVSMIESLINHSYDLVVKGLSKKMQEQLR